MIQTNKAVAVNQHPKHSKHLKLPNMKGQVAGSSLNTSTQMISHMQKMAADI